MLEKFLKMVLDYTGTRWKTVVGGLVAIVLNILVNQHVLTDDQAKYWLDAAYAVLGAGVVHKLLSFSSPTSDPTQGTK